MDLERLNRDFKDLISELKAIHLDDIAKRLEEVSQAILDPKNLYDIVHLDLSQLVNPGSIEEQAIQHYLRNWNWIRYLELIRNVLILIPVAITWLGISQASEKYNLLITADNIDPNVVEQPFLVLWEQGFPGVELQSPLPYIEIDKIIGSFSRLALIDFLLLFSVIALALFVHWWRDIKIAKAQNRASHLRSRIEQILWQINITIARKQRESNPSQIVLQLKEAFDSFQEQSKGFFENLKAEQERLENFTQLRVQEFNQLSVFSEDLNTSVKNLLAHGEDLHKIHQKAQENILQLANENRQASVNQNKLITALEDWGTITKDLIQQIHNASKNLKDSSEDLSYTASRNTDNTKAVIATVEEINQLASALHDNESGLRNQIVSVLVDQQNQTSNQVQQAVRSFETSTDRLANVLATLAEGNSQLSHSLRDTVSDIDKRILALERQTGIRRSRISNGVLLTTAAIVLTLLSLLSIAFSSGIISIP